MTSSEMIVFLPRGLTKWLNYLIKMTTEEQILEAARKVFISKGLDGSRMQEIADEAGINKALLHYYFRSKEKLFERIFAEAMQRILPQVYESIGKSENIAVFIREFINNYITLLRYFPFLPLFVLHEINRDPSRIASIVKGKGLPVVQLQKLIDRDVEAGRMIPIPAEHLMINIMSMIVFPVVARPFIKVIVFNNDADRYEPFFEERKDMIIAFVTRAIGYKMTE